MKRLYTEPEFDITRFSFEDDIMDDLAWHSKQEYGGTNGTIIEEPEPVDDPFA